jgi:adenylate cyclase class 2
MGSHNNLEVEVKFLVPDLAAIRERLLAVGAQLDKPRIYEHNIRYDNAWEGLLRKGILLRLRQDKIARLTFKGVPQEEIQSEAKVREELEIEVSDFATTAAILERIGFEQRQVYEKYRETFRLGAVEVVLDEMPFGNFVELEGEEEKLREAADMLQLEWDKRILDNYLALMSRLKERYNLPFDNLTFDNFAALDISIADLLWTN